MLESNEDLKSQNRRMENELSTIIQSIQTTKGQQIGLQRHLEKLERNRDKAILSYKKTKGEEEQARLLRNKVRQLVRFRVTRPDTRPIDATTGGRSPLIAIRQQPK